MLRLVNKFQSNFFSHILLYHSTCRLIPDRIKTGLHNVTPEMIHKQLSWLKKHFDMVELQQLFEAEADIAGKIAVTFDDAYESVFTEALPVLKSLKVPCTIFINGISFEQKPFWRDKIRFIINHRLCHDFISANSAFCSEHDITPQNFYRNTKLPRINSKSIDSLIDNFLEEQNIFPDSMTFCISDQSLLKNRSLVSYGNHTYSHYLLSSLFKHEQEEEIVKNQDLFKKHNLRMCPVFSIPFGESRDFNRDTIDLLKKHCYSGILYSRNALNRGRTETQAEFANSHIIARDRYMVQSDLKSFHKHIFKLGVKCFLSDKRPVLGFSRFTSREP